MINILTALFGANKQKQEKLPPFKLPPHRFVRGNSESSTVVLRRDLINMRTVEYFEDEVTKKLGLKGAKALWPYYSYKLNTLFEFEVDVYCAGYNGSHGNYMPNINMDIYYPLENLFNLPSRDLKNDRSISLKFHEIIFNPDKIKIAVLLARIFSHGVDSRPEIRLLSKRKIFNYIKFGDFSKLLKTKRNYKARDLLLVPFSPIEKNTVSAPDFHQTTICRAENDEGASYKAIVFPDKQQKTQK